MLFSVKVSAQDSLRNAPAVNAADSIDIYLITCAPHEEVYSLYGHTAIRVTDKLHHQDFVVNWGVFDMKASNFVIRFVFGLTDYMCAAVPTDVFKQEYRYYGSEVTQQHLALNADEKFNLLNALMNNLRPENRVYRYNFFYDNCTTRARDIIMQSLTRSTVVRQRVEDRAVDGKSFREMIHLKNSDYHWARFGNDLLLGVQADFSITDKDREFLPEVLQDDFGRILAADSSSTRVLVDETSVLVGKSVPQFEPMTDFPLSPLVCSWIIAVVVTGLTVYESAVRKKYCKWIDVVLFYACAVPGIILAAMIFSQHPTVRVNFQIFVFCPLWFWLKSPWTRWKYANKMSICLLLLFFLGAIFQTYAEGMMVLALCLLFRLLCYEFKERNYSLEYNAVK